MARREGTRHRIVPLTVAALAVTAGTVLSGCGTSRTIDGTSAGRQIASSLGARLDIAAPHVACPSGVTARAGQRFSCTATIDGQPLTVDATVTGSTGQFQPVLTAAVIVVAHAETLLAGEVSHQVGARASVTCDPAPALLVERPGQHFACTAQVGGTSHPLDVRVTDVSGDVTFTLEPASFPSTPGSTTPPGG